MQVQTAIIVLAAGAGTRMRSKTPKVLHTLGGRSMLAHSLLRGERTGARTSRHRDRARTRPGGRCGRRVRRATQVARCASRCRTSSAAPATPSHADSPNCPPTSPGQCWSPPPTYLCSSPETLRELLETHTEPDSAAVTVLTTTVPDPTGYGRIVRTTDGDVAAIVEEKDATLRQRADRRGQLRRVRVRRSPSARRRSAVSTPTTPRASCT